MGYHDLVLDRQVLVWVLIPLTIAVTLMMLLRQYAHQVRQLIVNRARLNRNCPVCRLHQQTLLKNLDDLGLVETYLVGMGCVFGCMMASVRRRCGGWDGDYWIEIILVEVM